MFEWTYIEGVACFSEIVYNTFESDITMSKKRLYYGHYTIIIFSQYCEV